MIDARRARKPKTRPEVFGLSTLDTVTCALGGSIMLLVMLAAGTIPEAPVALVDIRKLFQTGAGADGLTLTEQSEMEEAVEIRNLAMIYIDTGNKTVLKLKPTRCTALEPSIISMAGAKVQYSPTPTGHQHAFAIWPENASTINCGKLALELDFEAPPGGCRITLVSGNHYQLRPDDGLGYVTCPQRIRLRSNGQGVFQFDGRP